MKKSYKYSLLLLLTAIIWGAAFVAQSAGMDYVGPFTFNGVRCLLGSLVLLPIILVIDKIKKTEAMPWNNKNLLLGGVICGVFLFLASSAQQIGITSTSVGKSGFITALYIVLVPILSLFLKKRPGKLIWISVVLALVGLYFLCFNGKESFSLQKGDYYLFACAFLFACQIIAVDIFAPNVDCLKLACIEFFVSGILSIYPMLTEKPDISSIFDAWLSIGYAGFFSCGIAYTLQMVAQKEVKPAVASILMSLESVFSAVFGFLLLGQKLSLRETIGCLIMFGAVLLAQYELPKKKVRKGEKTFIRFITSDDTDSIVKWRNSEHVVKNFIYQKPLTAKDHENWLRTKVKTGKVVQFIIGINETKEEIGSVYFRDMDEESHTCEFGIFIGCQDKSGKGYGKEATGLALDYAFHEMNMKKILLRVREKNKAAISTYEKNGFAVISDKVEYTESNDKIIFMEIINPEI